MNSDIHLKPASEKLLTLLFLPSILMIGLFSRAIAFVRSRKTGGYFKSYENGPNGTAVITKLERLNSRRPPVPLDELGTSEYGIDSQTGPSPGSSGRMVTPLERAAGEKFGNLCFDILTHPHGNSLPPFIKAGKEFIIPPSLN